MKKIILSIMIFFLFIPITLSAYCYQETANESNVCGGFGTGVYGNDTGWRNNEYNITNAYDGNHTTRALVSCAGTGYFYVNYTIPNYFTNATWLFNASVGLAGDLHEFDIPSNCLEGDTLMLKSKTFCNLPSGGYTNYTCRNTSGSWLLLDTDYDDRLGIFDEGVYWYTNDTFTTLFYDNLTNETDFNDNWGAGACKGVGSSTWWSKSKAQWLGSSIGTPGYGELWAHKNLTEPIDLENLGDNITFWRIRLQEINLSGGNDWDWVMIEITNSSHGFAVSINRENYYNRNKIGLFELNETGLKNIYYENTYGTDDVYPDYVDFWQDSNMNTYVYHHDGGLINTSTTDLLLDEITCIAIGARMKGVVPNINITGDNILNYADLDDNYSNITAYLNDNIILDFNCSGDDISYYDNFSYSDINISTGLLNFTINVSMLGFYHINFTCNNSVSEDSLMLSFSLYDNQTPNVTIISPTNMTPTYNESDEISFNVTVDDRGNLNYFFRWVLDGITQAFTRVWTWATGIYDSGYHNVTMYANDTFGNTSSEYWNVTILNINVHPEISDLYAYPVSLSQDEGNFTIICNATDSDSNSSDLNVTIRYRDSNDFFWKELPEYYHNATKTWNASKDPLSIDTGLVDISCRASDGDLDSDWEYAYDYIEVLAYNYPPSTPTNLNPIDGKYDYGIPVKCSGSIDNNSDQLRYHIWYKCDSGDWILFHNETWNIALFDLGVFNHSQLIDFKCSVCDYKSCSAEYNPTGKINVTQMPTLMLYQSPFQRFLVRNTPYQVGVFANLNSSYYKNNTYIQSAYADCNGDDLWDYYWTYEGNGTLSINENFECVNYQGQVNHKVGVVLTRFNESKPFTLGLCKEIDESICLWERVYELVIL